MKPRGEPRQGTGGPGGPSYGTGPPAACTPVQRRLLLLHQRCSGSSCTEVSLSNPASKTGTGSSWIQESQRCYGLGGAVPLRDPLLGETLPWTSLQGPSWGLGEGTRAASETKAAGTRSSAAFTGHRRAWRITPEYALKTSAALSRPVSHCCFSSDPANCEAGSDR